MSLIKYVPFLCLIVVWLLPGLPSQVAMGQDSNLEKALKIQPKHTDIDFDTPTGAELENCKIESAKPRFGESGWVVIDHNGRVIRKFIDKNKDTHLDQWSYYKDGIEVYRDIDSNFDQKADQYRWLGTAGVRWGIDRDQDGDIDSWKMISAEEVSYEVVQAIKNRDPARFIRLLIDDDEIESLGVAGSQATEINRRADQARSRFAEFAKDQSVISKDSTWIHFGGIRPGLIPAGTDGAKSDVMFYDSVTAVVDNGGRQHGQIAIGTLIKVGDAWKVIDLPEPIVEGKAVRNGALFLQASHSNVASTDDVGTQANMSSTSQELFRQYEEIDEAIQKASGAELAKLHDKRARLLTELIEASTTDEDRSNWVRQMSDMVSGAYQTGEYDDGIKFLQDAIKKFKQDEIDTSDIAYAEYRLITAYFSRQVDEASRDELDKVQEAFMSKLEDYVKVHPKSQHAPDAMMQLGLSAEFAGEFNDAEDWYGRIASDFANSPMAKKATGAKTRLNSEGKRIAFSGTAVDGRKFDLTNAKEKVVLIQYWATWCEPCKNDLSIIKRMYEKYRRQGFVVVSVSLDNSKEELQQFLQQNQLPWIHLFEEGGLDSPLADQLGISLVPTMLLIGADGKVIDRNITAIDLDRQLSRQFRDQDDE